MNDYVKYLALYAGIFLCIYLPAMVVLKVGR